MYIVYADYLLQFFFLENGKILLIFDSKIQKKISQNK